MPSLNQANPRFGSETGANLPPTLLQQWSGHTPPSFMTRQKLPYISLKSQSPAHWSSPACNIPSHISHHYPSARLLVHFTFTCVYIYVCASYMCMLVIFFFMSHRLESFGRELRINPHITLTWAGICLISNWCKRVSFSVSGATPRLVVLGTVRKQAEKSTRASRPAVSLRSSISSCFQVPVLNSCTDFP